MIAYKMTEEDESLCQLVAEKPQSGRQESILHWLSLRAAYLSPCAAYRHLINQAKDKGEPIKPEWTTISDEDQWKAARLSALISRTKALADGQPTDKPAKRKW